MQNDKRNYSNIDASNRADPRVSGVRRFSPIGTLVHSTDGVDSTAWLLGKSADAGRAASANYLIARDGTRTKLCPYSRFPYHAGKSRWQAGTLTSVDDVVSQLLIGIELEQLRDQNVTTDQYHSLALKIAELGVQMAWQKPYVVLGHYAVARPIGRRSDPFSFDWGYLASLLPR